MKSMIAPLLRHLTLGPDAGDAKPVMVENYSSINVSPTVADGAFKYKPLPGAVAADPPKEPQILDPRFKVGAMPLAISGMIQENFILWIRNLCCDYLKQH